MSDSQLCSSIAYFFSVAMIAFIHQPLPPGRLHQASPLPAQQAVHQDHDPVKIVTESVTPAMRTMKRMKFLEWIKAKDPSYLAIQEREQVSQESLMPQEPCPFVSRRSWNADVRKWRNDLRGLHLLLSSEGLAQKCQ